MNTPTEVSVDQQLAAIDQLLRDYQMLSHEKRAVIAWLDQKLELADVKIQSSDHDLGAKTRHIKHGLLQMQHQTQRQLERYHEYMDGLRHRKRQIEEAAP